ncbi:MAG TPA: hypothetical protein VFW98_15015 [Gemmatimonadaceae bacterium]|nr:hypothetical protein [Gemmatimonadaceae bacterium]
MRAFTPLLMALSAGVLVAPISRAAGQGFDFSGVVGYLALVNTPTAGVVPVARQWMLAEPRTGTGVDVQYGRIADDDDHFDDLVGGVSLPFAQGHADVAIQGGFFLPSCSGEGCDPEFVASAAVEGSLLRSSTPNALLNVGLAGRLGFGKPADATALSASVGLPISVAVGRAGGVQLVPFITPAFGWGRLSGGGDSESGTRLMLGGGLGVMNGKSGLGVNVGIQKVFIDGGRTVFGAGITWSGVR